MKTWPPRQNSCCQRCALVKRLSEEKGSLFNSSSLTPCHCWTGTEPGAGRAVRAALYLVSCTTVLKIAGLCSPTSSLHELIAAKPATIHLCRGWTGHLAPSKTGIIHVPPTSGCQGRGLHFFKRGSRAIGEAATGPGVRKRTALREPAPRSSESKRAASSIPRAAQGRRGLPLPWGLLSQGGLPGRQNLGTCLISPTKSVLFWKRTCRTWATNSLPPLLFGVKECLSEGEVWIKKEKTISQLFLVLFLLCPSGFISSL